MTDLLLALLGFAATAARGMCAAWLLVFALFAFIAYRRRAIEGRLALPMTVLSIAAFVYAAVAVLGFT